MALDLALFDLDNTLLAGDSDYLWGQFLAERNIVDHQEYAAMNQRFYDEYQQGTLDIYAFLRFSLSVLAAHDIPTLKQWRHDFMAEKIQPIILPKAIELIEKHRKLGHTLIIITATNQFVTQPIADAVGISNLLATEPEIQNGRFTGNPAGTPCFQEGKVAKLNQWLAEHVETVGSSWFYSDSHNDLPLFAQVANPVAVDPDETLRIHAQKNGWPVVSLR